MSELIIDADGVRALKATPFEVTPRESFVLMRQETVDRDGLHLPDQSKQKLWEVLKVGPGRVTNTGERVPILLEAGQRCMLDPNAGIMAFKHDRVTYGLVAEEFISATFTGTPDF